MYEAGFQNSLIVLADDNGTNPKRTQNAGRISSDMMLKEDQWNVFANGAEKIGGSKSYIWY